MKNAFVAVILCTFMLGGCATTKATADEIASCKRMEEAMGTNTTHDHGEMKGRGINPMNLSHERCQQILFQPE